MASELWKVRAEDGTTFGPATLASLQAWARDGRLAPSHLVSSNDQDWMPVTRIRQLDMDWVVEVSPGTFYGPIHQQALEDLIRDGSLTDNVLRFTRAVHPSRSDAALQSDHDALVKRMEALSATFAQRTSELEKQLQASTAECEKLKGQLGTKDLEFDAERQESRAVATRHQAELAKAQAEAASLARQLAQVSRRDHDFATTTARLAEIEAQLAETAEHRKTAEAEFQAKLQEERQALHAAEKAMLAERATQAQRMQDVQQLNNTVKTMQLRQDSLRKLLQQAAVLLGADDARGGTVIEDGVAVVMDATPPPRTNIALDQLEAQAQREIHRLGQQRTTVFGKRK